MIAGTSVGDSVLGVYISGYHITTQIVNLNTREFDAASYQRKAINSRGTATEIIDACSAAIQQALADDPKLTHIGIAMPGPFNYEQGAA